MPDNYTYDSFKVNGQKIYLTIIPGLPIPFMLEGKKYQCQLAFAEGEDQWKAEGGTAEVFKAYLINPETREVINSDKKSFLRTGCLTLYSFSE